MRRRLMLDPSRPWFADRKAEVLEYYSWAQDDLEAVIGDSAIDSDSYRDDKMCIGFAEADRMSEADLVDAYRDASEHYILRLMLAYDRVRQALPLANLILKHQPACSVMDYGCGVSDYGLVFANFGFHMSICDVAGGNLEFAKWRYERRKIDVKVVEANDEHIYPDLGEGHGFIAALEILEHLPSPTTALSRIHTALTPGGMFAVREKSFEEKQDGDHLASAHQEWIDGTYISLRDELFEDCTPRLGKRFRGSKHLRVYAKRPGNGS